MKKSKYSVEFIESIKKDDNIYIVMELCDGNLNDLLEKKKRKFRYSNNNKNNKSIK